MQTNTMIHLTSRAETSHGPADLSPRPINQQTISTDSRRRLPLGKTLFLPSFVATLALLLGASLVQAADGPLVSWGYDGYGEVSNTPPGTFTAVSAGFDHSVAIRPGGTLVSWGNDTDGEVSDTPHGTFIAVSAGGYFSVALRPDGTLVSWGLDNYDQVSGTPAGTFTAIAEGWDYGVAIQANPN